ncbi:hypothetical protein IGW14_32705 [Streptomyces hygroscopicus subsp. hygroscopicus]|uniref:hypothetical protein n=1 Tax=Streptomyces hygroscopicus TaxID=1912 RepID=UPI001C65E813|nr:hypothetical protein [Streptomyces hygroscopicus]MBW8092606.1 hypothetical protein [Streptomyces hygroscopicus subsp. hygroscopicus]
MSAPTGTRTAPARRRGPPHAAGFTSAPGAHGSATGHVGHVGHVGDVGHPPDAVGSRLVPGGPLAPYDGAGVLLEPVSGARTSTIGVRAVPPGGPVASAAAPGGRLGRTTGAAVPLRERVGRGRPAARDRRRRVDRPPHPRPRGPAALAVLLAVLLAAGTAPPPAHRRTAPTEPEAETQPERSPDGRAPASRRP